MIGAAASDLPCDDRPGERREVLQDHHISVTNMPACAVRPEAAKRAKLPVWVVLLAISLNTANLEVGRFCYPDHSFSWDFGALSYLGGQGKDGKSIKSWPYGLEDFEVLRNSRGRRLFTCKLAPNTSSTDRSDSINR